MPDRIRRPGPRGLIRGLLVLVLPALLGAAPTENRLYLSAGAPWGALGAKAAFGAVCGDTASRDTLYLSFEPARDDTAFVGFSGEVLFYAQPGDTLGSFWSMERGGGNNGGLVIQFGPGESFPQPQPWTSPGIGSVAYDRTAQSGRLRFVFAIPITHAVPVRTGTRYVLGRLLLGEKRSGLEGCGRAVCIVWNTASLGYKGRSPEVVRTGGSRWLSRGGPEGGCLDRIPAWRPNATGGGTVVPPPDTLR